MFRLMVIGCAILIMSPIRAAELNDKSKVEQAILDYIEAQHLVSRERMNNALHPALKKRTWWKKQNGSEFLMETSKKTMLKVAANYNKNGDKFPAVPTKEIVIYEIDGRVATAKLSADDWIDYMHLVKNDKGEWKVVNVLWQYHDPSKHQSR